MSRNELLEQFYFASLKVKQLLLDWTLENFPKISQSWQDDFIFPYISLEKKEIISKHSYYEKLDLNDLITILTRNWFIISSKFYIPSKERETVRKLQTYLLEISTIDTNNISRQWATDVFICLKTIIIAFSTSQVYEPLLSKLEKIVEEYDYLLEKTPNLFKTNYNKNQNEVQIKIGTPVYISGDSSRIGAVIGIDGERFQVLIDGRIETYYGEQINGLNLERKTELSNLTKVKTALTAHQITNPSSSNLYSLNTARIDFVPYQFRPALKMMKSDDPKILVADDVGVGKTIEAGLILKELEARSSVSSVLIICPRPLVAERKWESEMKRFDESFVNLDGPSLREAIYEMQRDSEWPDRFKKIIIPYSLFKSELIEGTKSPSGNTYRYGLEDLEQMPHFDLVIVDEAHTIRNPSTFAYRAVEMFCSNADAVVFLTATPLQNRSGDLYTLLHLLRPDLIIGRDVFQTMSLPNASINKLLKIVRRQDSAWQGEAREEINNILSTAWGKEVIQHNPVFDKVYYAIENGIKTRDEKVELITNIESLHTFNSILNRTRRRDIQDFCIRRSETIRLEFTPLQFEVYTALIEFEMNYLEATHGTRNVKFMMCTLLRQASSCILGLIPFLKDLINHRIEQIQEDGELFDYDIGIDDLDASKLLEFSKKLSNMVYSGVEDPKFDKLLEIIKQKQQEVNKRVIVFSTFRNTLGYLNRKLTDCGIRVGQIDGSVPDDERYELRKRFALEYEDNRAIDVILFSEVGCEGLDYQFCDTMINYDLPWNPMRIEQRIGRIDRRGQKSDTVRIHNLITEGTIDADVYDRCLSKIGVFEDHVGDCAEILGDLTEQVMQVMFDPILTSDERKYKLEKIAENDVLRIQEMRRLEQAEKSLFGFDLSEYMQNQDIQNAENNWINSQSLMELVDAYLKDNFGDSDYFKGKGELKTLRTTIEMRHKLLDHVNELKIVNENTAYRQWITYLKSNKPNISVTFDSNCAKENRESTFLTPLHPLVRAAAKYCNPTGPIYVGVQIESSDFAEGTYPFQIYSWKYIGLKPDIRLVAISGNADLDNQLLEYVHSGIDYSFELNEYEQSWCALEKQHYSEWRTSRAKFIDETSAECEYRMDQLNQSFNQRKQILEGAIIAASEDRIARMYRSQLDKLISKNLTKINELKKIVENSDIYTNLQVCGLLKIIKGGR